jgi:putative tryptophan/tyrosine transport system substrate-binding protein
MKRRLLIALLGGALAWPLAARAQQQAKLSTIGFLGADREFFSPWTAAFVERLRELGWIEGRTVRIEYRWAQGRPERPGEIAAELVRLKVDVIVTVSGLVPALSDHSQNVRKVSALHPIASVAQTRSKR